MECHPDWFFFSESWRECRSDWFFFCESGRECYPDCSSSSLGRGWREFQAGSSSFLSVPDPYCCDTDRDTDPFPLILTADDGSGSESPN